MLVGSVQAKTFRDRLRISVVTGTGLGFMAVLAVWAFSGVSDSAADLLDDLPEALSSLIGASGGGNYVVSEIFSLVAPIAVLVVAISSGVNAIAGEERDNTAGLLLAQPVTRRGLVLARAGVLVVHVVLTCALFAAGFALAATVADAGVSIPNAIAATTHLAALGILFGMVALGLSSATGSAATSTGATAALAVVANLASSMLPLVNGLEGVAKFSPWHYYDGSGPLTNGVDPAHLLVLVGLSALALFVAVSGFDRRDLGSGDQRGFVAMIPALDRVTRPRVSGVFAKTVSERAVLVGMVGGYVAVGAVGICLMFNGLEDTLADFSDDLPEAIARIIGGADLGTPAGWINAELFSIMLPLALIAVAAVIGVGAVAGEQKRHTLDLLLAAPITRRRVVLEKAGAMAVVLLGISVLWGAGIIAGSAIAGLDLHTGHVISTLVHLATLAALFGCVGLAIGCVATSRAALGVTMGLALTAFVVESFLPLSATLEPWAVFSPWHYFSGSDPLINGADWGHLAVLASLAVGALGSALILVDRRDIAT